MELEQQLRAALAPRDPGPEFAAGVMGKIARRRARRPGRFILIGAVAAVAAAAVMLAVRMADSLDHLPASTTETTVVRTPAIDSAPDVFPAEPRGVSEASEQTDRATGNEEEEVTTQKSAGFTVRLLPLQNEATDAASRADVDAFYAAFFEGLRAVPGLTLITQGSTGFAEDAPVDYELTTTGTGPIAGNKYRMMVRARNTGSDGTLPRVQPIRLDSGPADGTSTSFSEPAKFAAGLIDLLRRMIFPDLSQRRELEAKLLDPALEPRQRVSALQALVTGRSELGDPAVVRGAVDLATTVTDPAIRAQVWGLMRGARHADLVQPLVDSLRQDRDGEVRLQAATTLAADFAGDPRVRAAFETAAREDSRPLLRALSLGTIYGDAVWRDYIVTSLKDANRSDAERVEAFLHHIRVGVNASAEPDLEGLLDDEAIRALARALPRTGVFQRGQGNALIVHLGSIDHPAITDMLLESLTGSTQPDVRLYVLRELVDRSSDPRVHTALEKIADDDADPRLREAASRALQLPQAPGSHPAEDSPLASR